MQKMSFEGRPKEAIMAERAAREADPNYVPPENRINIAVGRLAYKPAHQKQVVYSFSSYKPEVQDFDKYIDECIQFAMSKGKIDFIYHTPNFKVYIGIS